MEGTEKWRGQRHGGDRDMEVVDGDVYGTETWR